MEFIVGCDLHLILEFDGDVELINEYDGEFGCCYKIRESDWPFYNGQTVVVPKAFDQTVLDTDNKVLLDDITVLEIPYAEVSNTYGTTVTIVS